MFTCLRLQDDTGSLLDSNMPDINGPMDTLLSASPASSSGEQGASGQAQQAGLGNTSGCMSFK